MHVFILKQIICYIELTNKKLKPKMMERGRKESLRRKLVNPSPALMNEISNQIIELGEDFPKDLLEIYIKIVILYYTIIK